MQAETRGRITAAAVELHGTVGPARTSVSAIAAQAGVQRATVYRHFPDDRAMFAACSAHWAARHPIPDRSTWEGISDPAARVAAALDSLYGWYEETAHMLANVTRDAPSLPALQPAVERRREAIAAIEQGLAAAFPRRPRRLRAALGLALDYTTWQGLNDRGLSRRESVALMCELIAAAAV
jgi:AcrR family transcriptional regulator